MEWNPVGWQNKKNINLLSAEFAQRVVKDKYRWFLNTSGLLDMFECTLGYYINILYQFHFHEFCHF